MKYSGKPWAVWAVFVESFRKQLTETIGTKGKKFGSLVILLYYYVTCAQDF